ncbi:hypothetical protein HAX54_046633, partial [Datura stramonium]|nr:hypothetical protein [Datura stramonium]
VDLEPFMVLGSVSRSRLMSGRDNELTLDTMLKRTHHHDHDEGTQTQPKLILLRDHDALVANAKANEPNHFAIE